MNTINDSDTINDLEKLKNLVDNLLIKAEEKINLAQEIQEEATLLKTDLSKLESVYNCLESLGGESNFIELVNRIKTAEEFLNISEEKYQNLEQHLQQELQSIKFFLTEKETIITSINDELQSLGKKKQEVEEYQQSLIKEYTIVKESIKPILEIINSSENTNILINLSEKINSYQNEIEYFKKLPEEIKQNQEIYQQRLSENINEGMTILRRQQENIENKQTMQEENLRVIIIEIQNIKIKISQTENHIQSIYEYLKKKPWQKK